LDSAKTYSALNFSVAFSAERMAEDAIDKESSAIEKNRLNFPHT
jgi:hypothetical protein